MAMIPRAGGDNPPRLVYERRVDGLRVSEQGKVVISASDFERPGSLEFFVLEDDGPTGDASEGVGAIDWGGPDDRLDDLSSGVDLRDCDQ